MRFVIVGNLKTGRSEGFVYRERGRRPPLVEVPRLSEPKDGAPPAPKKKQKPA